jgi:hypothetical protein
MYAWYNGLDTGGYCIFGFQLGFHEKEQVAEMLYNDLLEQYPVKHAEKCQAKKQV